MKTQPFDHAPVGTAVLEACAICGLDTGVVLFKARGLAGAPPYKGPSRVVAAPESRCEFCAFLELWCTQEKHDPKKSKVGAAKIVEVDAAGVRKLVAFVPFTEQDERSKTLADGTPFTFQHGMVLRAEREPDGKSCRLVEVLEPGLP